MKKTLILAVAFAGTVTFAANVRAGDALRSPKAQEQFDSHRTVSAPTVDMIDRSVPSGSPKQVEFAAYSRRVSAPVSSINLASAPRPNLPLKDPGYDAAWRSNALNQANLQVAPLK